MGLQKYTCQTSIFKILEFHSDNGSGFINHDTIDWRKSPRRTVFTNSLPLILTAYTGNSLPYL
jgi:transposase InsO family protein